MWLNDVAWYASQGEVMYSNYGYKSNEELLLGYGFVLEPNQVRTCHTTQWPG